MNADDIAFTDAEMRTLNTVARRITRIGRDLVEYDDVRAHLLLWMWEKREGIVEWRETKHPGYLSGALYKRGISYLHAERTSRYRLGEGDLSYYTRGMLRDALPLVWDHSRWLQTTAVDGFRAPSRPAEGNTRLAVLSDVSTALHSLGVHDRTIIWEAFIQNAPVDELAVRWGCTETAARKRVDRVLDKMVDRLGGPPPWWSEGREVRSNARAQAETE